jgi:hypothetical protein
MTRAIMEYHALATYVCIYRNSIGNGKFLDVAGRIRQAPPFKIHQLSSYASDWEGVVETPPLCSGRVVDYQDSDIPNMGRVFRVQETIPVDHISGSYDIGGTALTSRPITSNMLPNDKATRRILTRGMCMSCSGFH